MDILGLIAVLSFGLTCFGIGYFIGIVTRHKIAVPSERMRLFLALN